MKCEICHRREATVPVQRVVDGQNKELFACESCARGTVPEPNPMSPLIDLLVSVGIHPRPGAGATESTCPSCGMTRSVFRERHRLGCPDCYKSLIRDIRPIFRDTQSGMTHYGKIPVREKEGNEMMTLEGKLENAVQGQRFEEAACLRDRIQALRDSSASTPSKNSGCEDCT